MFYENKKQDTTEIDDNGSRSSAAASFNAWFPIVLGMMPGGGRSGGRDEGWPPVAAIANSVSHGERGVATSHAVAYGSQPSRSYPSSYPAQDQPATAPLSSRYYGGRQP
ncbi:hypothetical protein AAG570_014108 [Ranatra chinensis]|uniref:Uncharacterized protein n=1 Tax=Ranatra chinensis TaxID=642074 RepID=A0ABD0XRZ2_9HEMI